MTFARHFRFQTACLDRPPLIRLQFPGVPLPLNCNDLDITETSVRARPTEEPTVMSMNIYRAQVFQIWNKHFVDSYGDGRDESLYDRVRRTDGEIVDLMKKLPWYFQVLGDRPTQLPESLREILTWQHHILRTCISTQRIRMYRPFLSTRAGDSWDICVQAAADALVVYRTLREEVALTSRQKLLPQAYQNFSVAVTVGALLLVEGWLPIPNVYEQLKNMTMDLGLLDSQECQIPLAMRGRKVLIKMLSLLELRTVRPTSPEDARSLVHDISVILGGERTTRAYMSRLADKSGPNQAQTPASATLPTDEATLEFRDHDVDNTSSYQERVNIEATLSSLLDASWDELQSQSDVMPMGGTSRLGLLNWDMTGLLLDSQQNT